MIQFFKSLLGTMVLMLVTSSFAYAQELTPIAAADLYIKVLVNHDEASVKQLNDYLRPDRLRSGQSPDYASYANMVAEDKAFPVEMAQNVLELFPEPSRGGLTTPMEALLSAVQQARRKSQCKALSSEPAEKDGSTINIQVKFECQVVKVNENWVDAVQRIGKSGCALVQCRNQLDDLRKTYATAINTVYQGDLLLTRDEQETAWRNDFAQEPVDEMFDEL